MRAGLSVTAGSINQSLGDRERVKWRLAEGADFVVGALASRPRTGCDQNDVIEFVLLANQLEIELPKSVTTPMSSTATSAMSRPYSVTAIPSSDLANLVTAARSFIV